MFCVGQSADLSYVGPTREPSVMIVAEDWRLCLRHIAGGDVTVVGDGGARPVKSGRCKSYLTVSGQTRTNFGPETLMDQPERLATSSPAVGAVTTERTLPAKTENRPGGGGRRAWLRELVVWRSMLEF
jgi:hypothetical protein